MSEIKGLQETIHAWAISKEWRGPNATPRPAQVDVALFHSECSEALEELRKNADPKHRYFSYTISYGGEKFENLSARQVAILTGKTPDDLNLDPKPEGFGPECADIVIRILDTCEEYGIDLAWEIEQKMIHNHTRAIRHGGKLS